MGSRIQYLYDLFDEFNEEEFGNKLQPITLLIKRNSTKDGYYEYRAHRNWKPIRNELKRASITIASGCWDEDSVEGTLLHEMIHQYQCEILDSAPDHNRFFNAWARKLEKKYGFPIR